MKLPNGGRVVDAALLAHTVVLGCRSCRDGLNASVAGYVKERGIAIRVIE